jgi:hypothetical protein
VARSGDRCGAGKALVRATVVSMKNDWKRIFAFDA